jgi:hypothetical protein
LNTGQYALNLFLEMSALHLGRGGQELPAEKVKEGEFLGLKWERILQIMWDP